MLKGAGHLEQIKRLRITEKELAALTPGYEVRESFKNNSQKGLTQQKGGIKTAEGRIYSTKMTVGKLIYESMSNLIIL